MKRARYPYQYEDTIPLHGYTEPGTDGSAHLDLDKVENEDLKHLMDSVVEMKVGEGLEWIKAHCGEFSSSTVIYEGLDGDELKKLCVDEINVDGTINGKDNSKSLIVLTAGLDEVKELNLLLNKASESIAEGGYLWVHSRTSGTRKASILSSKPPVIRNIVVFFWYLWYRVFPKLRLTRWMYRLYERLNGKINRCYHRVEILGRIFRSGFEVVDEDFRHGHFYVIAQKAREPLWDNEPTGSPIIKLLRVGKNGMLIPVFKFRTMHSYSEYLQSYVYKYNNLEKGGKFADDYRVAGYGKFLRKFWLDELPMVANLVRGDVKLVGVRPISRQYYSLYSPEMQQLRIKAKPGILPPFYYEKKRPETMDEIEDSERRYTEAFLKRPFATDWRYFWGTVGNILFRGARSK
jgi:lipopolysaccharide/colanic/teichoic acid biosynthesis glycosyltransferase